MKRNIYLAVVSAITGVSVLLSIKLTGDAKYPFTVIAYLLTGLTFISSGLAQTKFSVFTLALSTLFCAILTYFNLF